MKHQGGPLHAAIARYRPVLLALIAVALGCCFWLDDGPLGLDAEPAAGDRYGIEQILAGGDGAGYTQAQRGRMLRFPDDHGVHPDYRHEWWYFTGNLRDARGHRYGYQFTLFRFAAPPNAREGSETAPSDDSAWATRQTYMAHAALTVAESRQFFQQERFSRGALGLAGAQAAPFAAWLYDWRVAGERADGEPPWQLQIKTSDYGLTLKLAPGKPRVLQGERGYSHKGQDAASHYYSYTRLPTQGEISIDGESIPVEGWSWYDREWGSGALASHQQGWDWFALQLDDGHDLMWYRMRRVDGMTDDASKDARNCPIP